MHVLTKLVATASLLLSLFQQVNGYYIDHGR